MHANARGKHHQRDRLRSQGAYQTRLLLTSPSEAKQARERVDFEGQSIDCFEGSVGLCGACFRISERFKFPRVSRLDAPNRVSVFRVSG